jgi:hypothetical protein
MGPPFHECFAHSSRPVRGAPQDNPTLVNKVDTLATCPHPGRRPDWLRANETNSAPGTVVFTIWEDVSGTVSAPPGQCVAAGPGACLAVPDRRGPRPRR